MFEIKQKTIVHCADLCKRDMINKQSCLKYQLDYDAYCAYMNKNNIE